MAPRLSAIILAAGFSSRMGELKPTLPFGTTTVLDRCINLFRTCGVETLVVTGHRWEETRTIAKRANARVAHNPDFASGMYGSIRTGVLHLEEDIDGFFLLPVDIPLVREGTIRLLVESYSLLPCPITYPTFIGKRGHPPLIGRECFQEILTNRHPEGGLRSLLTHIEERQPKRVIDIAVPDANILFDMDTKETYSTGLNLLTRHDYPTEKEVEVILRLYPVSANVLAHGRLVGDIAKELCKAISQRNNRELDQELCRVSGILHDLAKGHNHHEQKAGRWLSELGFNRVAEIVAAHKDLTWLPGSVCTEKEIVHLADKLAQGSRIVDLSARFEEKLALYSNNPEATQTIQRRYYLAQQLSTTVETEAGLPINDILSHVLAG